MQPSIETMKAAYDKHKNLKIAASEIGMKWQTLYWYLKRENYPIVGDKSAYGSAKDKFAARAESDFKRIVPMATDMNKETYQSKYDFKINGLKIDIKASNLNHGINGSKYMRWAFSLRRQEMFADFVVGMAYKNNELCKLFLFPSEQIRFRQTITISERGSKRWSEFEISDIDLKEFFERTTLN